MADPGPSSSTVHSGLFIDFMTLPDKISPESSDSPSTSDQASIRGSAPNIFSEASLSVKQSTIIRNRPDENHNTLCRPITSGPMLRSVRGMQGLLLAENGSGLVELDPLGGESVFKQGTRVMPGLVTPRGGTFGDIVLPRHQDDLGQAPSDGTHCTQRLNRHGTLLSQGVTSAQNAAELKSLLGNSRLKVKAGAKVLPPRVASEKNSIATDAPAVTLEQGKSRARVEIDILLDSEICVEGCYLTGKLHVDVKRRGIKDSPVFLAGGKLRVVGFEGIPDNNDRHTFYQHSALLSAISTSSHVIYASPPDEEGFSSAREGLHVIPFAMKLPVGDGVRVGAKGPFDNRSGVVVKYIAIASFKLKDNTSSKHSIAHFYRSCEVYPYLDASIAMAAATHPLLSTAARSLFLGGPGKLKLTASLHRNLWVAGQKCCVGIAVHNESKKTVKGLILSLIRTITVFHPHPHLDVGSPNSVDPDACQTTTTRKLVAETTLEAGQRGLKGHVTAKGWWSGVDPGTRRNFAHFVLLPPDALSIVRSRLLEVQYAIRVSLIAGSLSSELSVMLPVRIINHLSIDPPPSYPIPFGVSCIPVPVPVPHLPVPTSQSTLPAIPSDTRIHEADKGRRPEGRLASIFDGLDARDLQCSPGVSVAPPQPTSGIIGSPVPHPPLPILAEEGLDPELSCHAYSKLLESAEKKSELEEIREDDNDDLHEGDDIMKLRGDSTEDLLGNPSTESSDEEVDFVVGSAILNDDDGSVSVFTDFHIGREQKNFEHPMRSTLSSCSTYSMPSAEDDLHEEEPLPQQGMRERLVPIAEYCPRQQLKTPILNRDLSGPFTQAPMPSTQGSHALYSVPTRFRTNKPGSTRRTGFLIPQKSHGFSHQKSSFSQRVERLIATRRPPVPSMTSDSSAGDGTPALSTEGLGTDSSSEISPDSALAQSASTTAPQPRKHTSSPSNLLAPAQVVSASHKANSVRARIAELEAMCKPTCTLDVFPFHRPHSYDMVSLENGRSPDISFGNLGCKSHDGGNHLIRKPGS